MAAEHQLKLKQAAEKARIRRETAVENARIKDTREQLYPNKQSADSKATDAKPATDMPVHSDNGADSHPSDVAASQAIDGQAANVSQVPLKSSVGVISGDTQPEEVRSRDTNVQPANESLTNVPLNSESVPDSYLSEVA
eukprot:993224_1